MVKVPYETDKDKFKYIDSYSKVYAVNKNKNKKKKYIDSYRRKNDWCVNKKQRKYIDSYNRKEKNDWCVHCKSKKAKKVHKFLQYERKKWLMCTQ